MNRRSLLGHFVAAACAPFARLFVTPLPPDCHGWRDVPGRWRTARTPYMGEPIREGLPEAILPLRRDAAGSLGVSAPVIHADFAPDRHALAESINRGGVTGLHTGVDDLSDYAEQGVRRG